MAEVLGVKESLEILDGVKVLVVAAKKVLADGKLDLADGVVVFDLLKQLSVLSAAVQGADLVVAEAKDLSVDELNVIAAKVLEIVAAVKAA